VFTEVMQLGIKREFSIWTSHSRILMRLLLSTQEIASRRLKSNLRVAQPFGLNFRVADPLRHFEGSKGLAFLQLNLSLVDGFDTLKP
jgi:hypothetical protein